eukprot:2419728-Alexandrium_andersonii.AAC.1
MRTSTGGAGSSTSSMSGVSTAAAATSSGPLRPGHSHTFALPPPALSAPIWAGQPAVATAVNGAPAAPRPDP